MPPALACSLIRRISNGMSVHIHARGPSRAKITDVVPLSLAKMRFSAIAKDVGFYYINILPSVHLDISSSKSMSFAHLATLSETAATRDLPQICCLLL